MMKITRVLFRSIQSDLKEKIVIIGGPSQVGKTTLSHEFVSETKQYLNWDFLEDRNMIKTEQIDTTLSIVVLDEVHKYPRWRNLIKGIYDKYKKSLKILVTGFARLDHFHKARTFPQKFQYFSQEMAKFENLVACQLLKFCHYEEDTQGHKMELRYIKDVDNREVDFLVLKENRPLFAVECKTGERNISKHIRYFRERIPIPQFYQVHLGKKRYRDRNIDVLPFEDFCKKLRLP